MSQNPTTKLPEGWIAVFDQEYKQYFYVNQYTQESQWEVPTQAASRGVNGNSQPPAYQGQLGQTHATNNKYQYYDDPQRQHQGHQQQHQGSVPPSGQQYAANPASQGQAFQQQSHSQPQQQTQQQGASTSSGSKLNGTNMALASGSTVLGGILLARAFSGRHRHRGHGWRRPPGGFGGRC